MEAKLVDKAKLKPDKNQPRKTFNLDDLIPSIQERGIMTPLIIAPNNLILDGERRWRAANKIREIKEVPCVVVDAKDWNKADKRLETQLLINEMREDYNVIERAEAYQRYIDAGHSERELARLLGKGHYTIQQALSLLAMAMATREKLRKDDTNWSFHADIEGVSGEKIPQKQKERIHQRVFEGAFANQDELRETLQFAKEHPVESERIIEAKDSTERGLVMVGAERSVPTEYKPKKKMSQEDVEKMRFTAMVQALNSINSNRTLWAMSDAISVVKKLATREQKETIIRSIETIIRGWTKTLNELKK